MFILLVLSCQRIHMRTRQLVLNPERNALSSNVFVGTWYRIVRCGRSFPVTPMECNGIECDAMQRNGTGTRVEYWLN